MVTISDALKKYKAKDDLISKVENFIGSFGFTLNSGIDNRDKWKWTPLHYASDSGFMDLVKVLVEAGANIDPIDSYYSTPLMQAYENKKDDVAEYLISKGADVNHENLDGYSVFELKRR